VLKTDKQFVRVTDNGEGSQAISFWVFERFYELIKSGSREEGGSDWG